MVRWTTQLGLNTLFDWGTTGEIESGTEVEKWDRAPRWGSVWRVGGRTEGNNEKFVRIAEIWTQKLTQNTSEVFAYEDIPEIIQPFWISQEPVAWPWCNLAASQRRPYCSSVNSHSSVGASRSAVRRRWLSFCTVWLLHSPWPSEHISFVTTMCLPILQLSCSLFWQSITSPRSVSPPTAQIQLPATSGISQS
jgi:hypothetical protein